jgi:hypothetical protein
VIREWKNRVKPVAPMVMNIGKSLEETEICADRL